MTKLLHYTIAFLLLLSTSCIDNEALRGRLTLTLTDAPVDNSSISKVNIAIRKVDLLPAGSERWQTIKSFEEPRVVNLLEFTQGELYDLTEQYLTANDYEKIRLELNIATVSNGLIVFPQSTIQFTDGTSETLFVDGPDNYVVADVNFFIAAGQITFLTLDFDMRKSIVLTAEGYKLRPSMRAANTISSGAIEGYFKDFANFSRVTAFAYKTGDFNNTETTGDIPFLNAVTSTMVRSSVSGQFKLSFLPAGTYDIVFAELNPDGTINEVLGLFADVEVASAETKTISVFEIDLQ
jgi:Domain of unknown function (DUF4382)